MSFLSIVAAFFVSQLLWAVICYFATPLITSLLVTRSLRALD